MNYFRLLTATALMALAGCAGVPGIPDTTYFRLPPRSIPDALVSGSPVQPLPILVHTLLADGLYSDQALIYSLDPDGARLRAYHYQLWVDPPVRMLQRRLIGTLREAKFAPVVTDRLPTTVKALRIEGRLTRFERIRGVDGWSVAVSLMLRVDPADGGVPMLQREYQRLLPAGGPEVQGSVEAMGTALDQIFADFMRDFRSALRDA